MQFRADECGGQQGDQQQCCESRCVTPPLPQDGCWSAMFRCRQSISWYYYTSDRQLCFCTKTAVLCTCVWGCLPCQTSSPLLRYSVHLHKGSALTRQAESQLGSGKGSLQPNGNWSASEEALCCACSGPCDQVLRLHKQQQWRSHPRRMLMWMDSAVATVGFLRTLTNSISSTEIAGKF